MKIDLHTHTMYSGDSVLRLEDSIKAALKKGLDGIAVTDHDTVKGWKDALDAARRLGAGVILGEEVKTDRGEVLGLFLNEGIRSREMHGVIDEIRSQGGLFIVPHPFDTVTRKTLGSDHEEMKKADGIEVFNARVFSNSINRRAREFAESHGLAMTAGSDAHTRLEVGNAYTSARATDLEDFRRAILKKKTEVFGKKTPYFYHIFSVLARVRGKFGSGREGSE